MRAPVARIALAFAAMGCAPSPRSSPPPAPPLHLAPVVDLAPAAGLVWLLDARPREILAVPEMAAHVSLLFPDERLAAFAARHGGVDLRRLSELEIASYRSATLVLARGVVDPAAVERAFAARAKVDGRAIDRSAGPLGSVTRTWGSVNGEREQLALFGREAIGLEIGRFGPLRAAELFAEEKLRRSSPALRAPPLARASAILGDAPLRAFAPGPFDGDSAHALGGLLGASTAAAIAVRVLPPEGGAVGARLALRLVLLGAWKEGAPAAITRLGAALHMIADSSLGRLVGLDHPLVEPRIALASEDALAADLTIDALAFFRGLQMATGAGAAEILVY